MNVQKIYLRLANDVWRRSLSKYFPDAGQLVILECGIGPGNLLGFMEHWFPQANLLGLDVDTKALNKACTNIARARLIQASSEELPFPAHKFDVVLSCHMIEHLPQPDRFLLEAYRVLRPGGILALATPNLEGIGARLMGKRWSGWGHGHISLFPPDKWRRLIADCGFAILEDGTTGLSGIPIFQKLPFGLLNWGPLFLFGFFPWDYGEAYMCVARRSAS